MSLKHERTNSMTTTKHAAVRAQQRCIPSAVIEWLISYGASHYDHRGCVLFCFDSRSRERLRKVVAGDVIARHSRHFDCYVVTSTSGQVITVGHRTRRIRNA
jgi:hypothetical protein